MMAAYDERVATAMPGMFFSSLFGKDPTERRTFEGEKVDVDIIRDQRRAAIDVIRGGGQGNVNFAQRYTTKEYTPPLYWEEAPITASMLNKRLPGVDPYQATGRMAALITHATSVQREQTLKILREKERMGAEALLSGTVTLVNTESLDFKKKTAHSVTPGTKWDNSGDPIGDIESIADTIFQNGKMKPNTLVFGQEAWTAFINNGSVQTYLDNRRIEPGRLEPDSEIDGAKRWGRVDIGPYQFDIYIYNDFYVNASGANTEYMTGDSVIVMNRNARLDQVFAAVEVLPEFTARYDEMGLPRLPQFVTGEIIPFVYEKAPTAIMAGVQSAPLLIPTAIDTIGTLDNVDT